MEHVIPEDALDVAELENLLFPSTSFNETTLQGEIRIGYAWGVRHNGKLIAYILVRRDPCIADIIRLGVHPDFQRQGHGQRLLQKVVEEFQELMLTVSKDNRAALRLYLKHDFKIVGQIPAAGAWVMRRPPSALDD